MRDADLILTLTNDDQVNVLTTMLALQEGCKRGLSLVNDNSFQALAGQFGMEVAINPRAITVSSILGNLRRGNVMRVHAISDESAEVLEATITEGTPISGNKLRDLDLAASNIRLGAIFRKGEFITPRGGTELKTGDAIITSGGIYGSITNVKDDRFVVRVADNVKIELTKQSIGSKIDI